MWLVLVLGGKRLPPRRLLPWLLLIAFLSNAVPFSLFAWGEQWVPSNTASVLNATTPIWTLLLSMTIGRALPRWLTTVGVVLAFCRVLVVVTTHAPEPGMPATDRGMLWGSLAIGVAALLLLPMTLFGAWPLNFLAPAPLGAFAVLGFVGSGVAYLLYYKLLAEVSATQVVAVTYLLPLWGVFWGLVAGEAIGITTYVGVAITVAGLILLNLRVTDSAAATRSVPAKQPHPGRVP